MKVSAAPDKKKNMRANQPEGQQANTDTYLMRCVKTGGFSNTMIIGTVSIRMAATLLLAVLGAVGLWHTQIFHANWVALAAYAAMVNLVLGHTPTGRNMLTNIYGIVFKAPATMMVTEDMAVNTIGHGIAEADTLSQGLDVIPFKMSGTKNFALVYSITSGIGYWSSERDKVDQAVAVKSLYNILEGGESLMIVEKQDNDTGMLALKDYIEENETFEGDDFAALSDRRKELLTSAGTLAAGRSIQQYAILMVKPKNVNRTVAALRKCCKTIRPATHPLDVLFAAMGFEAGEDLGKGEA